MQEFWQCPIIIIYSEKVVETCWNFRVRPIFTCLTFNQEISPSLATLLVHAKIWQFFSSQKGELSQYCSSGSRVMAKKPNNVWRFSNSTQQFGSVQSSLFIQRKLSKLDEILGWCLFLPAWPSTKRSALAQQLENFMQEFWQCPILIIYSEKVVKTVRKLRVMPIFICLTFNQEIRPSLAT